MPSSFPVQNSFMHQLQPTHSFFGGLAAVDSLEVVVVVVVDTEDDDDENGGSFGVEQNRLLFFVVISLLNKASVPFSDVDVEESYDVDDKSPDVDIEVAVFVGLDGRESKLELDELGLHEVELHELELDELDDEPELDTVGNVFILLPYSVEYESNFIP